MSDQRALDEMARFATFDVSHDVPPDGGRLIPASVEAQWRAEGLISAASGLDDLPWTDASTPTRNGARGAKCRRHVWVVNMHAGMEETICDRCGVEENPAVSRRNRLNRNRGNRTSHDLAAYLGGRNVEALKLPHDVEACGARIQSKRLAQRPSLNAIVGLIEYIDAGPSLRALYWVGAGQRVSSGRVFLLLPELVGEHGWTPPDGAVVHVGRAYILELPVSAFRELRGVA